MNEETVAFLKHTILQNNLELPRVDADWMTDKFYHTAPYILADLCKALDFYKKIDTEKGVTLNNKY